MMKKMNKHNLPYYCTECGQEFMDPQQMMDHTCEGLELKKQAIKLGQELGISR